MHYEEDVEQQVIVLRKLKWWCCKGPKHDRQWKHLVDDFDLDDDPAALPQEVVLNAKRPDGPSHDVVHDDVLEEEGNVEEFGGIAENQGEDVPAPSSHDVAYAPKKRCKVDRERR